MAIIKEKLMKIAKEYIKLRDGNACWTCEAKGLKGSNFHGGHFIPDASGGIALRYHEDNIHPQCFRCNMHLGGNGAEYYRKMVKEYGQEFVDELFRIKNQVIEKWSKQDHLDMIEYYKYKINKLQDERTN